MHGDKMAATKMRVNLSSEDHSHAGTNTFPLNIIRMHVKTSSSGNSKTGTINLQTNLSAVEDLLEPR